MAAGLEPAQRFGGQWSLIKIAAVEKYFARFNQVLSKQPFSRIYIDAFAGSGEFTYSQDNHAIQNGLFHDPAPIRSHEGSAKKALSASPEFHRLIFIESNSKNVAALRRLADADPKRRATVVSGDANIEVQRICRTTNWTGTRGVIFLDPFGNSVHWSTLVMLSRTKLDLWYLFPLSGVYRNAPIDKDKLTPEKKASITRILGTGDWEHAFYRAPHVCGSLFGPPPFRADERHLDVDGIEAFAMERLKTLFPLVLKPRRLFGPHDAPLFSLFFAVANPSKAAQNLARPIAQHILRSL